MKTGLETIKLGLTNSVITVPEGRFYVINSLYLSNIDVVDRSASVYIKRPDSLDSYYLVKEAVISVQLALQVISNAVFLQEGDILFVDTSLGNTLDCVLSYEDKYKY